MELIQAHGKPEKATIFIPAHKGLSSYRFATTEADLFQNVDPPHLHFFLTPVNQYNANGLSANVPLDIIALKMSAALTKHINSTNRCECPDGTALMNGECVQTGSGCELGMVMVNGTCESLASPGMRCLVQEQCIDHSQCVNNSCQCIQGFQLVNGYCVPNNGGRCPVTQVCLDKKN
ncbi:unnamed protein product [Cylicostephanus goldi]|uniref:EB domain-containing protein n=1 Tax=Cylicostephanus goldi TaxID=71465 RepID=A0A3P7PUY8_CYLGO|nr:unnamed protein product [Cylicostephanus goldi]